MHFAISCGGTGGHVYPGLATALELRRRGHRVALWLTGRPSEAAAKAEWNGPVVEIPSCVPSLSNLPKALRLWPRAILAARRAMRADRPDALLAMGAYTTLPPYLAARANRVPIVLHEANVIPGEAVRRLSRGAAAVAAGFEETRFHLPRVPLEIVGLPLRPALRDAAQTARSLPDPDPITSILVLGGSLGAHALNQVVPPVLARLAASGLPLHVVHLTGRDDETAVRAAYASHSLPADVRAFCPDMAPLFARTHFAICRAGASTAAELSLFGIPALLVPFPAAAKDHQTANARALEKAGVADWIPESSLTPDWLEAYLRRNIAAPARIRRMRAAALRRGAVDSAALLADLLEKTARTN